MRFRGGRVGVSIHVLEDPSSGNEQLCRPSHSHGAVKPPPSKPKAPQSTEISTAVPDRRARVPNNSSLVTNDCASTTSPAITLGCRPDQEL